MKLFQRKPQEIVAPTDNKPKRKRKFAGAKAFSFLAGWLSTDWSSFSREIAQDLTATRARSRDLSINNPLIRRYLRMLNTYVVGPWGAQFKMRVPDNTELNKLFRKHFQLWGKRATVDGLTWLQAQRLVIQTLPRDGEVLIQLRRGKEFGPYGFQLQFLEPDQLDHTYNLRTGKNIIRQGIEFDSFGRPVAYHIWKYNPNDADKPSNNERVHIPASDILHIFDKERALQSRGYPWTASVMVSCKQLDEYVQTELTASRVAASKLGLVTHPADQKPEELLGDDGEAEGSNAAEEEMSSIRASLSSAEPGSMDVLPKGWEINAYDPKHPMDGFSMLLETLQRWIATGLSIAYHTLTSDLSKASYNSLRAGMIDDNSVIETTQALLNDLFYQHVVSEWLNMATTVHPNLNSISLELVQDSFEFTYHRRPFVDPLKDAKATTEQLSNLTKSRSEALREAGYEFETVMEEIAEDNKVMEKLGIPIPTDKPITTAGMNDQLTPET